MPMCLTAQPHIGMKVETERDGSECGGNCDQGPPLRGMSLQLGRAHSFENTAENHTGLQDRPPEPSDATAHGRKEWRG